MNIGKSLSICTLLVTTMALTACKQPSLTSDEAFKQIREKGKFPKLVANYFGNIPVDSLLGKELTRLVNEGYMTSKMSRMENSVPEKGRGIVKYSYLDELPWGEKAFFQVELYTHVVDVDPEADKRISVHGDSAEMQFTLKSGLSEYGQRLRKIDPSIVDPITVATNDSYPNKHGIGGEGVAFFERWDSGWRLVRLDTPYGNLSPGR